VGIFYRRALDIDALESAIGDAMREDPAKATTDEVRRRAKTVATAANSAPAQLHVGRLAIAILIAAALIVAAIVLAFMSDAAAIAEAERAAQNQNYEAPDLAVTAAAEWLRTLASAWSAGLVGLVLGEKSGT
jgi:hypothetical protein